MATKPTPLAPPEPEPAPATAGLDYHPLDPIPVPDAFESDTDTTWAHFSELSPTPAPDEQPHEPDFPDTVPLSLDTVPLSLK